MGEESAICEFKCSKLAKASKQESEADQQIKEGKGSQVSRVCTKLQANFGIIIVYSENKRKS